MTNLSVLLKWAVIPNQHVKNVKYSVVRNVLTFTQLQILENKFGECVKKYINSL